MQDLSTEEGRLRVISDLTSDANMARKQWSWRAGEVQAGRLQQLIKENLEGMYDKTSVKEMPIVSSINIQKRIVDRKATIYKERPKRIFTDVDEAAQETLQLIYRDGMFNEKLNQGNKDFLYQDQTIGMIVPCSKTRKLKMRILKMHQIDSIASNVDPEQSQGFIISVFDRENYQQQYQDKKQKDTATSVSGRSVRSSASELDGKESKLSNEYQYAKYVEQFIFWTPQYNFMTNGLGEIIDPATGEPDSSIDIESPLAPMGMMPFFEVAREKDFEYFVRSGYPLTDFTVQFNTALSDLQNNIKMNGYSVAVLKAPSDLQPQNQVVGAAMLLKLPTDDPEKEIDFSFHSPNSSIGEISNATDRLLNYFVTTQGEDRGAINSAGEGEKSASGIDRFLSMVDRLHASKDDYEMFRNAEYQIYEIVKAWLEVLSGTDQLDRKYWTSTIPLESEVKVDFHKPEMIQTEQEKIAIFEKQKELGLKSRVDMIMEMMGIDRDQALEEAQRIDQEEGLADGNFSRAEDDVTV